MILYFSGTGNSKYVAERIARQTQDKAVSLNLILKQNKKEKLHSEAQPFVFVCPIYAWRLPRVVDELIRELEFIGSRKVYFVLTCGSETANAIHYVKQLCHDKGWDLQGFGEVIMPENYIVMYPAPDEATAKELLNKADPVIDKISEFISQGSSFYNYTSKGAIGKLESGLVNSLFYPVFVHAKGFHVTEKCIGCAKCAKLCPLNNIHMSNNKPIWGNDCTHCMACIGCCPTMAIEYKNKTKDKVRYFLK